MIFSSQLNIIRITISIFFVQILFSESNEHNMSNSTEALFTSLKEIEQKSVMLRELGKKQQTSLKIEEFIKKIKNSCRIR